MIDFIERSLLVALCKKMFDENEVDSIMGQIEEGLTGMNEGESSEDAKILINMYRKMLAT